MTDSEVADVLRAAHDEMLIRGRSIGIAVDDAGRVCLQGAIAVACGIDLSLLADSHEPAELRKWCRAFAEMAGRGFTARWNDLDTTTTDDVLDAFLNTEKQLREAL